MSLKEKLTAATAAAEAARLAAEKAAAQVADLEKRRWQQEMEIFLATIGEEIIKGFFDEAIAIIEEEAAIAAAEGEHKLSLLRWKHSLGSYNPHCGWWLPIFREINCYDLPESAPSGAAERLNAELKRRVKHYLENEELQVVPKTLKFVDPDEFGDAWVSATYELAELKW